MGQKTLRQVLRKLRGGATTAAPPPNSPPPTEEADLTEIGTLLKQERDRLGLRHVDIQARSDIDTSFLSRMENDRQANPTISTLRRYALALNKTIVCKLVDLPTPQVPPTHADTVPNAKREQKIDRFITGLHLPPYEMAYSDLARERAEEIGQKYFPRVRDLTDVHVDLLLGFMEVSIDINGDRGMIEDWRRTCHGIADYLLRPGDLDGIHAILAAECVIRLSGYYHHGGELYTFFRRDAMRIGDMIWGCQGIPLPYIKMPDPWTSTIPTDDHEGYVLLWDFAGNQRALASRILCFLCQNDYRNIFIPNDEHDALKQEYDGGAGNRALLMRWSVSSEYVDRIARVLIVDKQHLTDFLTRRRFNQSQMYKPSAGPRDRWFLTWQHQLPRVPATV